MSEQHHLEEQRRGEGLMFTTLSLRSQLRGTNCAERRALEPDEMGTMAPKRVSSNGPNAPYRMVS
jgi:hypothetical protein